MTLAELPGGLLTLYADILRIYATPNPTFLDLLRFSLQSSSFYSLPVTKPKYSTKYFYLNLLTTFTNMT